MMSRHVKHFVVTLENGRLLISRAREIVPNHRYEIIHIPTSMLEWLWPTQNRDPYAVRAAAEAAHAAKQGIGLGEKMA